MPEIPGATARQQERLDALLARVTRSVARLPARYEAAARATLREALAELRADMAQWLATAEEPEARFTAQRLRLARLLLEQGLRDLEQRLDVGIQETLYEMDSEAMELSRENLRRETIMYASTFGLGAAAPIERAARIRRGEDLLMRRYRTSAARYAGQVRRDIQRQLAVGVAKNETFSQLTRRLQRIGGPRGLVALRGVVGEEGAVVERIEEGLFRRYGYWAERLVRTEGIEAYNREHLRDLREHAEGDPGYVSRWDAAEDSRVCEICRSLDGLVVTLTDDFPAGAYGADSDRRHPPAHPNCRCALIPWRREWEGEVPRAPRYSDLQDVPETRRWLTATELPRVTGPFGPLEPTSETRMDSIRQVFRRGQDAVRRTWDRGVRVAVRPDGQYEVVDGRHRILVAREFPDIQIPVRFVRGT